jgi:hypothetical protein
LPPGNPVGDGSVLRGVLPIGGGLPGGGGFIGGMPGGTSGGRRPVPVRRAMPAGAVIGEDAGRVRPGNGSGMAGAVPMRTGGGRGAEGRRSSGRVDAQADQQWETDEGVAPVIRPDATEVRHDPGPGVIGFDR